MTSMASLNLESSDAVVRHGEAERQANRTSRKPSAHERGDRDDAVVHIDVLRSGCHGELTHRPSDPLVYGLAPVDALAFIGDARLHEKRCRGAVDVQRVGGGEVLVSDSREID